MTTRLRLLLGPLSGAVLSLHGQPAHSLPAPWPLQVGAAPASLPASSPTSAPSTGPAPSPAPLPGSPPAPAPPGRDPRAEMSIPKNAPDRPPRAPYREELEVSQARAEASRAIGGQVQVVVPDRDLGADATAADVLRLVPSVKLKSQGGDGARQVASVRGASEEQVLVLLDGVRLNEAGGGGVDLCEIPAASIAKIEVITGAAAALYGPEAVGGVIAITTRVAGGAALSELSSSWGSFGTTRANAARVDQAGEIGLLASLSALTTDGNFPYQDTNGQTRIRRNNDARVLAGMLKANRPLSGPWRLEGLLRASDTRRGVPGPEQFESDSARQGDQRALASLTLRGEEVAPGLSYALQGTARGGWFAFTDPSPAIGQLVDSFANETSLGASGRMWLRRGRHQAGAELSLWGERLVADTLDDGAERRRRGALAFADEITLGQLTLAPALRLEGTSGIGLAPLPRLGASYSPLPGLVLKAAAGRAYRPPSFRDLFVRVDGVLGNPDLAPEESWEGSAGVSYARTRGAAWGNVQYVAELSAFARRIDNAILFTPESAFVLRADNFSDFRARGAELRLAGDRGWLSWEGTAALLRAESGGAGRLVLPGLPARRASARAELRLARWARLLGAVDAQSGFFLNRHNTAEAPARCFVSAGAVALLPRGLSASAELRNLFDQRGAVDGLQQPLPPRTLTLSVRAAF